MSEPAITHRTYTEAEYFEILTHSEEKWEFFDGEVYAWEALAGTTSEHAAIAENLSGEIRERLKKKKSNCGPLGSDSLLHIPRMHRYRYPDLTVLCGPPQRDRHRQIAITNPTVLLEIVSESSREADYGVKFEQYATITSLLDYAIVEQDFPLVTVYSRERYGAPFTFAKYFAAGDEVFFPSIDVRIPLDEVYRNIVWEKGKATLRFGHGLAVLKAREPVREEEEDAGEEE